MSVSPFSGFRVETVKFFTDLSVNNNREWFKENKPDYERFVMAPARDFVMAMGERLRALSPAVVADPRVNKSIFRIYRDVRFSKDKSPYKAHLGLWFPVSGTGGKFENPGYYFHLEPGNLMLGVGIHGFSKSLLKVYRDAVVNPDLGPDLALIMADVLKKGYSVGSKTYKRVPRGYDTEHKFADLLQYSGLTAGADLGIPPDLYSPKLVEFCFSRYQDMAGIVRWMRRMKEKAGL